MMSRCARDRRLLALCTELSRKIEAHHRATAGGAEALAQAGYAVVTAAQRVSAIRPLTMEGFQAKARLAYVLACDGGNEPSSNGLVHTIMIALTRDLISTGGGVCACVSGDVRLQPLGAFAPGPH